MISAVASSSARVHQRCSVMHCAFDIGPAGGVEHDVVVEADDEVALVLVEVLAVDAELLA